VPIRVVIAAALFLILALVLWNWLLMPEHGPVTHGTGNIREVLSQEAAAAVAPLGNRLAAIESRLGALERAVAGSAQSSTETLDSGLDELVSRLEAVEVQLRRMPDDNEYGNLGFGSSGASAAQGQESRIAGLEEAFQTDDALSSGEEAALENAASIFDRQEVSTLQFRELECSQKYCKLRYEDNSPDSATSTISENELLVLLAEKYGNDIVIHGGEMVGKSRTFFIERNVSR
jgi:hypothetical protein